MLFLRSRVYKLSSIDILSSILSPKIILTSKEEYVYDLQCEKTKVFIIITLNNIKKQQGPVTVWNIKNSINQLYITKNQQGPVTNINGKTDLKMLYITKNQQGPVTLETDIDTRFLLYITKNQQGPVTA